MWTAGIWAAVGMTVLVGASLGLVGGGGSILTMPLLVYVAGLPVPQAVALSLAIVGVTAAVGGAAHLPAGSAHSRAALVFGVTGAVGAVLGAQLTPLVPAPVLLMLFAGLMLVVGARMLRAAGPVEESRRTECCFRKCAAAGLGLGVLTGFLGVGGGFLVVPALLRFAKMPMRQAVGTSLLIIAANSASGFAAHLPDVGRSMGLALAFTAAAVAGMYGGLVLGRRMAPAGLKQAFGGLSLAVAAFLVVKNIGPLLALVRG